MAFDVYIKWPNQNFVKAGQLFKKNRKKKGFHNLLTLLIISFQYSFTPSD